MATKKNTKPMKESDERSGRTLIQLAHEYGVATAYTGQDGEFYEIGDEVLIAVLKALNVDASDDAKALKALEKKRRTKHLQLVRPTVLHVQGVDSKVKLHHGSTRLPKATVTLEDGTQFNGGKPLALEEGYSPEDEPRMIDGELIDTSYAVVPAGLPLGYHTLHITVGRKTTDSHLISVPEKIDLIGPLKDGSLWGWMAQLYSVRSRDSWGVGDFADLRDMLAAAKSKTGADFILINPVHAAEPVAPLTPSPYLPVSRRYINFTYIRPENIEEYAALPGPDADEVEKLHMQARKLNEDPNRIDRDAMWRLKRPTLWKIFEAPRSKARQEQFTQYCANEGEDLRAYAIWCLAYDKWGAVEDDPGCWEKKYSKDSPEIKELCEKYADTLEFYMWLEWIATQQLAEAQKASLRAGMKIGIVSDMAVGVHSQGAEVWWNPERFARGVTVGAPPDMFNQQGQNWSQPPFNPVHLEETGYSTYRNMVAGMFAKAGAVRIDHILGLFRLWWIPEGNTADKGTYVQYDSSVMLGILALEASRVNGTVVGEDLGVVPDYVADSLKTHGLMGCVIEWYQQYDGEFVPPRQWREMALASVTTHDMPPTAGYLAFEHAKIRERLGLLAVPPEHFLASAKYEQKQVISMLVENGYLDKAYAQDIKVYEQQVVEALHRALLDSPSKLKAAALVDAVGERRAQNQPGTDNEYPNWRVPLADSSGHAVYLNDLFDLQRTRSLADVMNGRK